MKKKAATLAIAILLVFTILGVLVRSHRMAVHAEEIDRVLRDMSTAFRNGDVGSVRVLCTSDCAPMVDEWMATVSKERSSSLGWHPLADPPAAQSPVIEKGFGIGNVDYYPNAKWGWLGPYGQFYRFREERGEWRYAGYQDIVR